MPGTTVRRLTMSLLGVMMTLPALSQTTETLSNWKLQDAANVQDSAQSISSPTYEPQNWYTATVPGTVLTTLVANKVYPEPLYGENMRAIPESLNKTPYWYRTTFNTPKASGSQRIWLHFGGINYASEIWVNGVQVGTTRGAFIRGDFDITSFVKPGSQASVAVRVSPQPHPGIPHEHTIKLGVGLNGGETAIDGPTFLSTIGWDWLVAIRDRDTGIWQPVTLSVTGPVVIKDPFIESDVSTQNDHASLHISTTLANDTDHAIKGMLKGSIQGQDKVISFEKEVTVPAQATSQVVFDPKDYAALQIDHPKLWWPNGYGPQNLSHLTLRFVEKNHTSDQTTVQFGVRRIEYQVPDSENLTLSVNGVRVMARGGNWGLDEGMKRIPRERLEAQFRMHAMANLNIIRNWVGQSTSPDFYDLADQYGILLWDEFFQPNPSDGPDPADIPTYLANVTDKIKRYRNHPAIAVWCARNEGYPPKDLDNTLKSMMTTLDPTRLYQSNSTDGRGVSSHGPYYWRAPRYFYTITESFKTETGSVSVPTIESIQGMMPRKDWETINDDWAQHDMAAGAQRGNEYPITLEKRYGQIRNLADFVRKGQLANYEAFRAMFEGRNSDMFKSTTGVITWMSHPAQPSFVWQLYHYDLDPMSSLFAVQKAAEKIHVQLNESNGAIEVVNNTPATLTGMKVTATLYDLNSHVISKNSYDVTIHPSSTQKSAVLQNDTVVTPVYFVKLDLTDTTGKLISTNFYWQTTQQDNFAALQRMAPATLDVTATAKASGKNTYITATIQNKTPNIALMAHLQMHRQDDGERVLPAFYSDNYLSLIPGEQRTVSISVPTEALHGQKPLVLIDGYNVDVHPLSGAVAVAPNVNAQPMHWPETKIVQSLK